MTVIRSICSFFAWIRRCFGLAVSNGVFRRSTIVSIVVGTILTLINQGEVILRGETPTWWEVILTYVVPFLVSAYGAMGAILSNESKANSPATIPLLMADCDPMDLKFVQEEKPVSQTGTPKCNTPTLTKSSDEGQKNYFFNPQNAENV